MNVEPNDLTNLRGPAPKTTPGRTGHRIAGLLALATLTALAVAPLASAGPGYWIDHSVAYHRVKLDCHASLENECTPECPYPIVSGATCMVMNYPREVYEDFIGDWPL